jgi:hypothetical protein
MTASGDLRPNCRAQQEGRLLSGPAIRHNTATREGLAQSGRRYLLGLLEIRLFVQ